jgi:hypothetical protein
MVSKIPGSESILTELFTFRTSLEAVYLLDTRGESIKGGVSLIASKSATLKGRNLLVSADV